MTEFLKNWSITSVNSLLMRWVCRPLTRQWSTSYWLYM